MATTTFPLGAYINQPDNSNAATMVAYAEHHADFTRLMGTTPQFLTYFLNEHEALGAWAGNAQWAATSAAQSAARTAVPVIAMPLTSASTLSADAQYKAFASGQNDGVIQAMVKAWAAQGFTTQYWRPGWEMNLASMPSYAGTDKQTQADWVAAFRHVSDALHAAGKANGVDVQVVWNPSVTNYDALGVLKNLYPGNTYVDVIGADIYADAYPYSDGNNAAGQPTYHDWTTGAELTSLSDWLANPANLTHYWSNPAATRWSLDSSGGHNLGLSTLLDFARTQDKPFAIPETGAGNAAGGHDVADDAAFPTWLAQTLQASGNAIRFVNLWDSNGGGTFKFSSASDGKPKEAASWAQAFGAQPKLDALTLRVSEDAYNGDAQFTVSVDGVQVGGVQTATASHATGASQVFAIKGSFGTAPHKVAITFLNDAYGGPGRDRNLYIDGMTYNGTTVADAAGTLYSSGTAQAVVPYSGPITADTLGISVSEDAYKGHAQFLVTIDGQQLGGVQTATASHAAGRTTTLTFSGSFGPGAHTVAVSFLNDAYDGPGLDRNLYVDAMTFNGKAVANSASTFLWNDTHGMVIPASSTVVTPGASEATITLLPG